MHGDDRQNVDGEAALAVEIVEREAANQRGRHPCFTHVVAGVVILIPNPPELLRPGISGDGKVQDAGTSGGAKGVSVLGTPR